MPAALVTGASRGLGLEFVRQLAARGDRVFAACRRPPAAAALAALARTPQADVRVVALDVGEPASIAACARTVAAGTDRLDLLVNAAGVYSGRGSADPQEAGETLGRLEMGPAIEVLRTNAVGPLLVAQAFLGLLRQGRKPRLVSLSSGYGSVSANTSGFPYYYAASKAALNMSMRSFAADAAATGLVTVLLDPGWVRTDMGGPHAPVSAPDSVAAMLAVIDGLEKRHNGAFLDRHGRPKPW
jgi:NAD(P)-dependent dehydrogenase (short-subunit alcohol dehydrogenase family)